MRGQGIAGSERGEDLLEHFARLAVSGTQIATQMAEQQLQRLLITTHLMQLQCQLCGKLGIRRVLLDLLLQQLDFRRIGCLLQKFDLRDQPLLAGILILQRNGFQHRFGIF